MFPQIERSQLSQIISITYAYLTISFGFISLYSMSDDIVYLSCFLALALDVIFYGIFRQFFDACYGFLCLTN